MVPSAKVSAKRMVFVFVILISTPLISIFPWFIDSGSCWGREGRRNNYEMDFSHFTEPIMTLLFLLLASCLPFSDAAMWSELWSSLSPSHLLQSIIPFHYVCTVAPRELAPIKHQEITLFAVIKIKGRRCDGGLMNCSSCWRIHTDKWLIIVGWGVSRFLMKFPKLMICN